MTGNLTHDFHRGDHPMQFSEGTTRSTKLDSEMATRAHYNPQTRILAVAFQSGEVYQYFGVPPAIFYGLKTAASAHQFFTENIRDFFPFKKLDPTQTVVEQTEDSRVPAGYQEMTVKREGSNG